jgi:threonine dehydrogenase-like Zn-dependent dehydrogenase
MRAPGRGGIEDLEEPTIGPYDARVRMVVCGLCNRTDTMVRRGEFPPDIVFPSLLGHEPVREVGALGGKVRHLEVGQLVTRRSAYPLNEGPMAQHWGGLSEVGVVRDELAMVEDGLCQGPTWLAEQQCIVRGVNAEHATLAISVSEAVSVARDVPLTGANVVVVGTGIAGLSLAMHASRSGARSVTCIGHRPGRLEQAMKCGADHVLQNSDPALSEAIAEITGGGADVVFPKRAATPAWS